MTAVLGWYGKGNVGDESYKLTFPLLHQGESLHFSSCIDHTPSKVVLGGGDVIYTDFTSQIPDGCYKTAESVSLTKNSDFKSLSRFDRVIVRDHSSLVLAADHNICAEHKPDFAFMLKADEDRGRGIIRSLYQKYDLELYDKVVVVVYSAYLAHVKDKSKVRDYVNFQYVTQSLANIIDSTSASFVFVPFCTMPPHDDRSTNGYLASHCKWWRKNLTVFDVLGVQDTLNVIAAANAVISTRLHSSIFSTIAHTPFVDITHHTKNKNYLDCNNLQDWSIPFWEFDWRRASELLNSFIERRPDNLIEIDKNAKEQLLYLL